MHTHEYYDYKVKPLTPFILVLLTYYYNVVRKFRRNFATFVYINFTVQILRKACFMLLKLQIPSFTTAYVSMLENEVTLCSRRCLRSIAGIFLDENEMRKFEDIHVVYIVSTLSTCRFYVLIHDPKDIS